MDGLGAGVLASVVAAILVALAVWIWQRLSGSMRRARARRFLSKRVARAGIANVYTTRADYETAGVTEYLLQAERTVHVASYWLAHGIEMENAAARLAARVRTNKAVRMEIAVLDPNADYLSALADYLDIDLAALTSRVCYSLSKLHQAKVSLDTADQTRMLVKVYDTIPTASLIMLDVDEPSGRIQVDYKPYKIPRRLSVGYELRNPDSPLYQTFRRSTLQLLEDASEFDSDPAS